VIQVRSIVAAAAALAAAALGVSPATTAVAAPPTPGAGWYLTTIEHGRPGPYGIVPDRQRLVLVSPDGHRTQLLDQPARKAGRLVDWSPDGSTALLVSQDVKHPQATRVDVATGDTTVLPLPADVAEAVLAPDGLGVLAVAYQDEDTDKASLSEISWDGTRTTIAADVDGPVLPSPDGASLVTHGRGWHAKVIRVLSSTDGTVEQRISTPSHCTPVRWWDDQRVLVDCSSKKGTTTLSLVDVADGTVAPLTGRTDPQSEDLGHLDARRIDSGLYVQVAGPCGYVYLGHQHRGRITKVRVPGAVGNVLLIDGSGSRLTLEHAISCDGATPRSALTRFDPRTKKERTLVLLR
jgi:TolB protein